MITALILTAVLSADPAPAPAAREVAKLLQSGKEPERLRGIGQAQELPQGIPRNKPRSLLCEVAKDDPSHLCRQAAIQTLGKIGDDSCVAALAQVGAKHCICEKLAFKSLMQIGTTKARAAAEKMAAGCDNETLKEEMERALELRQDRQVPERSKRSERFEQ